MSKDTGRHAGNIESKELSEQTGKGVIRASAISTYARCKFSYFMQYVMNSEEAVKRAGTTQLLTNRVEHLGNSTLEIPFATQVLEKQKDTQQLYLYKRQNSAVAALGTSIHKAMEVAMKYKMVTGGDADLNLLVNEAEKEWDMLVKEATNPDGIVELYIPPTKTDTLASLKTEIPDLVMAYQQEILPFVDNPTATEGVYRIEVNNPLIHSIQGSIDVEQEKAVRDLKITAKKTQKNRHIAQLSTYAWIREQSGKPTETMFIDNLARNKTRISASIMEDKAKTKYIDHILRYMLDTTELWYNLGCVGAGSTLSDILTDPEKYKEELKLLKVIWSGSNPSDNFLCTKEWCGAYEVCPFVKNWEIPRTSIIDGAEEIII